MRFARDMLTSERDMQHSLREIKNKALIWITPHPFSPIRKAQGKLPLTKTSFRVSGFLTIFSFQKRKDGVKNIAWELREDNSRKHKRTADEHSS